MEGKSHEQAIAVLDEFLAEHGEELVKDPLKRAILQRDLWAVFDWTAEPGANTQEAYLKRPRRRAGRCSFGWHESSSDWHCPSSRSRAYPTTTPQRWLHELSQRNMMPTIPERPFLPPDLFQKDGPWVEVEVDNGSTVIAYTARV